MSSTSNNPYKTPAALSDDEPKSKVGCLVFGVVLAVALFLVGAVLFLTIASDAPLPATPTPVPLQPE